MMITKIDPMGACRLASEGIANEIERAHYIVYEDHYLVAGNESAPELEKAKELGIRLLPISTNGGSIVVGAGDIGIGILTKGEACNPMVDSLRESLVGYLKSRGLEVVCQGNDVLVSGYKVASHGTLAFGRMFFAVMQISINVDLEAIKAICTKPMVKTPKGLSEYGITTEEVERWLENWLKDNFLSIDNQ